MALWQSVISGIFFIRNGTGQEVYTRLIYLLDMYARIGIGCVIDNTFTNIFANADNMIVFAFSCA